MNAIAPALPSFAAIEALTPREPIKRVDTPDRNAPCPCGSGKKYKHCHGKLA